MTNSCAISAMTPWVTPHSTAMDYRPNYQLLAGPVMHIIWIVIIDLTPEDQRRLELVM